MQCISQELVLSSGWGHHDPELLTMGQQPVPAHLLALGALSALSIAQVLSVCWGQVS